MDVKRPDMGKLAKFQMEHLPVWASGNAYLGGARAWKKENICLVDNDAKVDVELVEENGKYKLKTNVFDYIKDFNTGIITSDILGVAFQPEQRFENTDGSAITFDLDYFGDHRGLTTVPGPFVSEESLKKTVW